jgi:hypothetical protein
LKVRFCLLQNLFPSFDEGRAVPVNPDYDEIRKWIGYVPDRALESLEFGQRSPVATPRRPRPDLYIDALLPSDPLHERLEESLVRPILDKQINDPGFTHQSTLAGSGPQTARLRHWL